MDEGKSKLPCTTSICGHLCHLWMSFFCPIKVKYALGHGKACMRVVVGGTPVMFDHGRVPAPADVAVRTA